MGDIKILETLALVFKKYILYKQIIDYGLFIARVTSQTFTKIPSCTTIAIKIPSLFQIPHMFTNKN